MEKDIVSRLEKTASIRERATADRKNEMLFVVAQESLNDAALMRKAVEEILRLRLALRISLTMCDEIELDAKEDSEDGNEQPGWAKMPDLIDPNFGK